MDRKETSGRIAQPPWCCCCCWEAICLAEKNKRRVTLPFSSPAYEKETTKRVCYIRRRRASQFIEAQKWFLLDSSQHQEALHPSLLRWRVHWRLPLLPAQRRSRNNALLLRWLRATPPSIPLCFYHGLSTCIRYNLPAGESISPRFPYSLYVLFFLLIGRSLSRWRDFFFFYIARRLPLLNRCRTTCSIIQQRGYYRAGYKRLGSIGNSLKLLTFSIRLEHFVNNYLVISKMTQVMFT